MLAIFHTNEKITQMNNGTCPIAYALGVKQISSSTNHHCYTPSVSAHKLWITWRNSFGTQSVCANASFQRNNPWTERDECYTNFGMFRQLENRNMSEVRKIERKMAHEKFPIGEMFSSNILQMYWICNVFVYSQTVLAFFSSSFLVFHIIKYGVHFVWNIFNRLKRGVFRFYEHMYIYIYEMLAG